MEFGFPLDFNRNCPLRCDNKNHSSATEYPNDVEAYIKEESDYQAILGPFPKNPIPGGHCSPFMTRSKPNSDRRRVIVDLSWPVGESVNAGIDKNMYLGSQFDLNFPSVDHITEEAKRIGRGALLYKVDVSRAFRHVKVDPGDYDLLVLQWYGGGPRWESGNTLASHLCGRGSIPIMAVSGKAGSCLPLVGSLQYTTLANSMYWFPLPFQLPVVI